MLFDGVVILEQLKNTRGLKVWAVRAKKQWLGTRCATSVHFSFLFLGRRCLQTDITRSKVGSSLEAMLKSNEILAYYTS